MKRQMKDSTRDQLTGLLPYAVIAIGTIMVFIAISGWALGIVSIILM